MHSDNRLSSLELNKHKHNILFDSIVKLRTQLLLLEKKEKDRAWNLNGLSKLTDVINKHTSQPKTLFDSFLTTLVKYIEAVQGGIYITETDSLLLLQSSYAYDRIKKTQRVFNKGQGIIGEVWEEEKTLYIENIPENHFTIKSALGDAKPSAIMIVPLMEHGKCYGVLEISSFEKLDVIKRNFIEKTCEILASATANVMANQTTKNLLKESQKLTEKLKTQEDTRQNKIKTLTIKLDKKQKELFSKDQEIKELRFVFNQAKKNLSKLDLSLQQQKENFKIELKESLKNNKEVTEFKEQVLTLQKSNTDLEETLKIRNLKIEKLRKKLTDV